MNASSTSFSPTEGERKGGSTQMRWQTETIYLLCTDWPKKVHSELDGVIFFSDEVRYTQGNLRITCTSLSYPTKSRALVNTVCKSLARIPWYMLVAPFSLQTLSCESGPVCNTKVARVCRERRSTALTDGDHDACICDPVASS